ncbi:putative membrane protein [Sphaerochaeta pleomorpha str. Grapes]|uniref:Putative membrane protein n=1 Tax=Sphaerochaeta pleomorpha (strain ATCC BAA-1885 / DSM 22778 / Grapes) TaxID=158190 RepID=G8QRR7_SPHPG|nr:Gx transporter family protein [Sphaerochaeta pleomorpha]AEV28850.1 putative membrane protein [Sphaerochaeta pleomorpha str. Grapes]
MSRIERKIAFVAATTLLCATLEYLIPKPLPFLKLGLANLPLLICLEFFTFKQFFILLLLKSIGQGFVSGTLFSYLFLISLAGTLSSGIIMKALKSLFKDRISLVGCSLAGAMASNFAQLQVASVVAYGKAIWVAAPLMLSIGLASSFVLGLLAQIYQQRGTIPALLQTDTLELSLPLMQEREHNASVAIASLLCILAILLVDQFPALALITLLMYVLQFIAHRRILVIPPLMLLFSMVLLSLFEPNGKVLLSIGSVALTDGALNLALVKALRLVCLLSASQCISASNPNLKGRLLAYIPLTLGYFNLLSSSFKSGGGSLIERVDRALIATASGEHTVTVRGKKAARTISKPLFSLVSFCVCSVAILSKFLF